MLQNQAPPKTLSDSEPAKEPRFLLTKSELAVHLRCSERQVDLLRDQFPKPIRLGSAPRWSRVAIIQWIEAQNREVEG